MKPSRAEVASMLDEGRAVIIADWSARVRADPSVPQTEQVGDPALIDHVPTILETIASRLRGPAQGLASEHRPAAASSQHAHERLKANYDVAAIVREFGHLRAAALAYLRSRGAVLDPMTEELLHSLLDHAACSAAGELAHEQQDMLEAIITQSAEGIVAVDAMGRIRMFNEEAVRQHGLTDQKVAPSAWTETYGLMTVEGQPLPLERTPLYRAMKGERVTGARWQVRRPDGSVREFSGSATPLRHHDGTPQGAVLIIHDETERLRAERRREVLARFSLALARSLGGNETVQQLLALVVPEFADYAAIDTVEADGRFRRAGFSAAPGAARVLEAARHHEPSSAPDSPVAQVMASREPLIVPDVTPEWLDRLAGSDAEYRHQLDVIAPASILMLPLVVRNRPIGVLKLMSTRRTLTYDARDLDVAMGLADRAALAIDNARAYEDARDRAERLGHEAEWRERFMAMLSHDLRAPLSVIQLSAETMARDPQQGGADADALGPILRASRRATRMIADLLDFARAHTGGGIPIQRGRSDLKRVVEQVIADASKRYPERRVELSVRGACDGQWDDDRITQVVENLVTNALRYSPAESAVSIEIGAYDETSAFLRIRNSGRPIPPEVAASLFEPFKRASVGARRTSEGLGLGLYISSEIARAHGGELSLEYSDARGTSFLMRLPRAASAH